MSIIISLENKIKFCGQIQLLDKGKTCDSVWIETLKFLFQMDCDGYILPYSLLFSWEKQLFKISKAKEKQKEFSQVYYSNVLCYKELA